MALRSACEVPALPQGSAWKELERTYASRALERSACRSPVWQKQCGSFTYCFSRTRREEGCGGDAGMPFARMGTPARILHALTFKDTES
jgi:hypothetical protein